VRGDSWWARANPFTLTPLALRHRPPTTHRPSFSSKEIPVRISCISLALAFAGLAAAPAASVHAQATGAVTTGSGLVYESLKEGAGKSPQATDTVKVHYKGTFLDGKEFDSSYKRGEPTEFPLNRVIPCWTEGVQRMKPGGKAKLTCPPAIAYGERGAGGVIPPNTTLNFEIELLSVR
jgi:FKBP-type peptidyl-prolyl cis-trans isomerase FkpA